MPECFLDTNLVEVLLEKSNSVNHKKGNGTIARAMDDKRLVDSFVVGVIDEDKIRLKKLDEFTEQKMLSRPGLKLFTHPARKHFFIQVRPAIEQWILKECEKGEIDLQEYELPESLKALKLMKGLSEREDARFKRLFKAMLENEKCDELIVLKNWLIFLRDNNYDTDFKNFK
jgi:hypothetical protein